MAEGVRSGLLDLEKELTCSVSSFLFRSLLLSDKLHSKRVMNLISSLADPSTT